MTDQEWDASISMGCIENLAMRSDVPNDIPDKPGSPT